jgi:DNA (cytosine-5)-methyltransferase 1
LFSGIGGLELGLEWAGLGETLWQVEQDEYCRSVLAKHWPNAERFEDVRTIGVDNIRGADVICGGFPCQDISVAGSGTGLDGDRSGLWWEFDRLIGLVLPRFVVIENVPALTHRGLSEILCALARRGYSAEWDTISAAAIGARHRRDRLFLIAWRDVADASGAGLEEREGQKRERAFSSIAGSDGGSIESRICPTAHGVPGRVARLKALGNAVVPQVAHQVGLRIIELIKQGA